MAASDRPMRAAARGWVLLALCALLAVPQAALAQADKDKKGAREREVARRAQQALKKAEDEKAVLLREKIEVDDKLKAATAKLAEADKTAAGLKAAAGRARVLAEEIKREKAAAAEQAAALAALQGQLKEAEQRIGAAGVLQTETQRTLASRDAQLRQLQAALAQTRTQANSEIGVCEAKNAKLYTYGTELMRLYRDKTAFDAMRQAEPLTGLKAVEIDNVLEEYRDKLGAQRGTPR